MASESTSEPNYSVSLDLSTASGNYTFSGDAMDVIDEIHKLQSYAIDMVNSAAINLRRGSPAPTLWGALRFMEQVSALVDLLPQPSARRQPEARV